MRPKIDPKVVMDLSIFKLMDGTIYRPITKIDWKTLLVRTNRGCLSELHRETHSFVTQNLERHSASSDQYMK